MSLIQKLRTEVLPKAVEDGKFGKAGKFIDFRTNDDLKAEDQFCATIIFGDVVSEAANGDRLVQSVVIKTQTGAADLLSPDRNKFGLAIHLYSEFLFYEDILPLLVRCDRSGQVSTLFPRYFLGSVSQNGDPADDFMIFENVQKLGFKLTSSKGFIDYDHIELALRAVARFHALSLVCKRKYPEEFRRVVSKIRECHWTDQRLKRTDGFYRENCKRGVWPLENDPEYRDKLTDLWSIIDGMDDTMKKLVTPVEPLAVICHGDFCRNNFFYKYDSSGRSPVEIMFFDLATIRYSSPVIDLSFFLYMNTSPELRSTKWRDILSTYHTTLISNLDLQSEDTPSFEDFQIDFRRRGFYGYAHAVFFLPMMICDGKPELVECWWNSDVEKLIKIRLATGGEKATQLVTEIAKHMIDERFDFKYIVDFKLDNK